MNCWPGQPGTKASSSKDDYDSEYRYTHHSLPSLQGADSEGRVIYVGTFSKILMPGIRLGYLVIPKALRPVFVNAKRLVDRHSDNLSQAVLADFMANGSFARHVSRMKKIYAVRHKALCRALDPAKEMGVRLFPSWAGLHICVALDNRHNEELGAKDVQIEFWSGLFAPAGTPAAIVETLRREISDYMGTAEMKDQADLIGMKAIASDPDTLRALIERDIKTYSTIADSTNVTTR